MTDPKLIAAVVVLLGAAAVALGTPISEAESAALKDALTGIVAGVAVVYGVARAVALRRERQK